MSKQLFLNQKWIKGKHRETSLRWIMGISSGIMLSVLMIGAGITFFNVEQAQMANRTHRQHMEKSSKQVHTLVECFALRQLVSRQHLLTQLFENEYTFFSLAEEFRENSSLQEVVQEMLSLQKIIHEKWPPDFPQEVLQSAQKNTELAQSITEEMYQTTNPEQLLQLVSNSDAVVRKLIASIDEMDHLLNEKSKQIVAGTLEAEEKAYHHARGLELSLQNIFEQISLTIGIVFVLIIALYLGFFFFLRRRLGQLTQYAEQMIDGQYEARLSSYSKDAVGKLGVTMEMMAYNLSGSLRNTQEHQKWFEGILSGISDAVITTDINNHVTYLNPAASRITEWSLEEAVGKEMKDVFHIVNEESLQPIEISVERASQEGVIAGLAKHTVLITKSGKKIPIDDDAALIRDKNGEMLGIVLIFRDVNEE